MPGEGLNGQGSIKGCPTTQSTVRGPLSLLGLSTGPSKAYGGVHTFLRIKPRSCSSPREGPPCIGCLAPVRTTPSLLSPQNPSLTGPHRIAHAQTAQDKYKAGLRGEAPKECSGPPSLTIGRTRAQTTAPEAPVALKTKEEELSRGLPLACPPSALQKASVVVLPPWVPSGGPYRTRAPQSLSVCRSSPQKNHSDRGTIASQSLGRASCRHERVQARALAGATAGPPQEALSSSPWGPSELLVCPRSCLGQTGYEGPFRFGALLQPDASQEEVFRAVGQPAAQAVLEGLNACIAV